MSARAIEVEIGELALSGFSERDRDRVGSALRSELTRLLAGGAQPAAGDGAVLRLDYQADARATPEQVGRAAAESIARGLGR